MKRKIVYGIFAATLIGTAALTVTPSTAQAATTTGWVKESGKWYFYKDVQKPPDGRSGTENATI